MDLPEGYRELSRKAPFWQLVGPFYEKPSGETLHIGLRVEERHCNVRGTAHGGLIATLADVALGYNIACATKWQLPIATVNLSTDYAGAGRVGDWLEAQVDIQRLGRTVIFANTYIFAREQRIARASGVFSVLQGQPPRLVD